MSDVAAEIKVGDTAPDFTLKDQDQKDVFNLWMTGPMKPITKYGGMPKPTGCV